MMAGDPEGTLEALVEASISNSSLGEIALDPVRTARNSSPESKAVPIEAV